MPYVTVAYNMVPRRQFCIFFSQPPGNMSTASYNISTSPPPLFNNTGSGNLTDCDVSGDDGPQSYISIGLFMAGIVLSRFGECMLCSERERERGKRKRNRDGGRETGEREREGGDGKKKVFIKERKRKR